MGRSGIVPERSRTVPQRSRAARARVSPRLERVHKPERQLHAPPLAVRHLVHAPLQVDVERVQDALPPSRITLRSIARRTWSWARCRQVAGFPPQHHSWAGKHAAGQTRRAARRRLRASRAVPWDGALAGQGATVWKLGSEGARDGLRSGADVGAPARSASWMQGSRPTEGC